MPEPPCRTGRGTKLHSAPRSISIISHGQTAKSLSESSETTISRTPRAVRPSPIAPNSPPRPPSPRDSHGRDLWAMFPAPDSFTVYRLWPCRFFNSLFARRPGDPHLVDRLVLGQPAGQRQLDGRADSIVAPPFAICHLPFAILHLPFSSPFTEPPAPEAVAGRQVQALGDNRVVSQATNVFPGLCHYPKLQA